MENCRKYCKRCHRELKDELSIKLGYGKICYAKINNVHNLYLFEMEDEKCLDLKQNAQN